VKTTVTTIIHNAWRLDFNLALSSFEPYIQGTQNLVNMARMGPFGTGVRFLFTSSIASAQAWNQCLGNYPEEHVDDVQYARGTGYGESKYVAERVGLHFFLAQLANS
jgi:nucleoside-diphosphate-sugar epimerase